MVPQLCKSVDNASSFYEIEKFNMVTPDRRILIVICTLIRLKITKDLVQKMNETWEKDRFRDLEQKSSWTEFPKINCPDARDRQM